MDADWSVELGDDDPTLAVPWASPDASLRYYDLRLRPDLLLYVDEAARFKELGEFLAAVNSKNSRLQSAKCDAWTSSEISEAEEIYGASLKFCSYVDLFFADPACRGDRALHEEFARRVTALLKRAPQISAAAEFIVRRAHFEDGDAVNEGYYLTFELAAYGDDEEDARKRWMIALNLIANAILQWSAQASGDRAIRSSGQQ
ncbi:MAG: hypothetical protein ACRD3E_18025 [Terriglobales bacterium]